MLLAGLSLISAGIGCKSKAPRSPEIPMYLHDREGDQALCSFGGTPCPAVPMSGTRNWIMFKPEGWEAWQNYIDLLVCRLNGGCE